MTLLTIPYEPKHEIRIELHDVITMSKTCQVVVMAQTKPQENTLENPVAEWLGNIKLLQYSSGIMSFGCDLK